MKEDWILTDSKTGRSWGFASQEQAWRAARSYGLKDYTVERK